MLDDQIVQKFAIRSLRRGIGSMDCIHTLLIAEDDLDEDAEVLDNFGDELEIGKKTQAYKVITKENAQVEAVMFSLYCVSVQIVCQCPRKSKINALD